MSIIITKLKPCPFCDSCNVYYHNGWKYGNRNRDNKSYREPSITCQFCGIGMSAGVFDYGISNERAEKYTIERWNNRVNDMKVIKQLCIKSSDLVDGTDFKLEQGKTYTTTMPNDFEDEIIIFSKYWVKCSKDYFVPVED